MRDPGYRFVASAKPDGQCLVIIAKDSPMTQWNDARGKRWVMPEKESCMSKLCAAELRDRGIAVSSERLDSVREQGVVLKSIGVSSFDTQGSDRMLALLKWLDS